jgi:hypothetical protein
MRAAKFCALMRSTEYGNDMALEGNLLVYSGTALRSHLATLAR